MLKNPQCRAASNSSKGVQMQRVPVVLRKPPSPTPNAFRALPVKCPRMVEDQLDQRCKRIKNIQQSILLDNSHPHNDVRRKVDQKKMLRSSKYAFEYSCPKHFPKFDSDALAVIGSI